MEFENFYDLLEEYLDEEEIKLKKEMDFLSEEKNRVKSSKDSPFSKEQAIKIGEFVNNYLNMEGDYSNLLHSGLRELDCFYVVGVDNMLANKNPELVLNGYILIVLDCKNRRGTYVNPFYLKKLLEQQDLEKEFEIFSKQMLTDLSKIKEYYDKYIDLQNRVETNTKFYNILVELNKVRSLDKIKRLEKKFDI